MRERQQKILDILNQEERISVEALSERFGCSKVTIRNDIRALAEQGLLERTHGGAMRKGSSDAVPAADGDTFLLPGTMGNLGRKQDEKRRIAAKAYEYIEENDTIILDDSSACYYLAVHISNHPEKQVAVLTNSLASSVVLSGLSHVYLYLIGGQVGGSLPATMGEQTIDGFHNVHVDKAFISVHSINFKVGLTSIGTPQMQIKRAIFQTTDKVYVLADSSKFGAGYLEVVCPLKEVHRVITDDGLKQRYVESAEKENIPLDLC